MLRILKASAQIGAAGAACVALLEAGITRLLERSGFSRDEIDRPVSKLELMPVPTMLRALDYARAEAIAPLNDEVLSSMLSQCIGLIHAHRVLEMSVLDTSRPRVN